jgi:hypothetical protein
LSSRPDEDECDEALVSVLRDAMAIRKEVLAAPGVTIAVRDASSGRCRKENGPAFSAFHGSRLRSWMILAGRSTASLSPALTTTAVDWQGCILHSASTGQDSVWNGPPETEAVKTAQMLSASRSRPHMNLLPAAKAAERRASQPLLLSLQSLGALGGVVLLAGFELLTLTSHESKCIARFKTNDPCFYASTIKTFKLIQVVPYTISCCRR